MGQALELRSLVDLLKSLFSVEKLREWVYLGFGRAVADELPGPGTGLAQLAFEVAMALERHGLVGPALFEALIKERPGRREEILALARALGVGGSVATGTPASAGMTVSTSAQGATAVAGVGEDSGRAGFAQAGPVVRVLHLSDFHFRQKTRWDASTVLGRLAADVAGLVREGLAPDLVVLTGDIAQSGKAEEYAQARAWILGELLPAAGVGVDRLMIAPGNHDVDRDRIGKGAPYIADGLRGSRDEQHVTDVMAGEDGRLLLRRLDAFVTFVNELGVAGGKLDRPWYAVTRTIGDVQVHCAALCSAWLSSPEGDHGKLLLGLWQCNEVLREAEHADVVIAALHHPWSYVAEWDLAPCLAEIEHSAGLVLRGHLHDPRHDHHQSPRHRGVLELAAGACYDTSEYPNSYHLVEIRPDAPAERRARVYPRFWDRTRREWQADLNVFRGPFGELPLRVRGAPADGAPSLKEEIRRILIEVARRRGTIAYSELSRKVTSARLAPDSPELAATLGEISCEEDAAGRGMLSALVVRKQDMKPGSGFFQLARQLGRDTSDRERCWTEELQKIHRHWSR